MCGQRGEGPQQDGPGVTAEHLKPILDSARVMARASIPEEVLKVSAREALLGTSSGGLFRGPWRNKSERKVEKATAPFQYALSTRAGCECIAHAIQAMTDANPQCTVLSVDGIGAHDTIFWSGTWAILAQGRGPFWLKESYTLVCAKTFNHDQEGMESGSPPTVGCK